MARVTVNVPAERLEVRGEEGAGVPFLCPSCEDPAAEGDLRLRGTRHQPYFLPSCMHRITTATSEGIKSKIQTSRQMACGCRSQEHYKTAISSHSCGPDLPPRPEAV